MALDDANDSTVSRPESVMHDGHRSSSLRALFLRQTVSSSTMTLARLCPVTSRFSPAERYAMCFDGTDRAGKTDGAWIFSGGLMRESESPAGASPLRYGQPPDLGPSCRPLPRVEVLNTRDIRHARQRHVSLLHHRR